MRSSPPLRPLWPVESRGLWTQHLMPGWAICCRMICMPPGPFQPRQRAAMLHRELLRRAGRWAELLTVDSTDEEAHLGVAQDLLIAGDRSGALRQLDVLEQVLRDEMGIGPSPEAYDLRIQALDTPVHAPRPTRPPAPRHRRTGPADGALLPHVGWRPTCLRHQWGGAAAGQGVQLDDAFGL